MLSMLSFVILSTLSAIDQWEDVKVGDCLTVDELKELSGVWDTRPYETDRCGVSYATEGPVYQSYGCGIEIETGSWTRSVVEHRKPGVFFPFPVPCKASVDYFKTQFEVLDLSDPGLCEVNDPQILWTQTEEMFTKRFSAGQGTLILPHPMVITKEISFDHISYFDCEQTQLSMEYLGWGDLSGEVERRDCLSNEREFCLKARLENSENGAGEQCLKVKRLDACSP